VLPQEGGTGVARTRVVTPALQCFEFLARLYQIAFLDPAWAQYPALEHDPKQALALFLGTYAFERQGSSPDYAPVAAEVALSSSSSARTTWNAFREAMGERGLNHACNPMCPKGTEYERAGEKARTWQISVFEFVTSEKPTMNLVAWARQRLSEDDAAAPHAALCGVGGVSDKIASFFLRDVATMYDIHVTADRHLLQPIDVWVERCTRVLRESAPGLPEDCAKAIVTLATEAEVCPESVNQGMWYFATQVCHSSRYAFQQKLGRGTLWGDVEQHVGVVDARGHRTAEAWGDQRSTS